MLPFTNRLNAYFLEDELLEKSLAENIPDGRNDHLIQNLNNSAFVIHGYLEILLTRGTTSEEQLKYLVKAYQESCKLNQILKGYCKSL